MTEQNQNILNMEYDEYITSKYESKIQNSRLEIGNLQSGDPEVTNFKFLEKFNIQTLKIYTSDNMSVKLQSKTIKELNLRLSKNMKEQVLNLKVDDLELENLEVLVLYGNQLDNNQLFNLVKFKKLCALYVSENNVDLTHIHMVSSLTKLYMQQCELKNIDEISSLTNLEVLDVSSNNLKNVDSMGSLIKLKELNISANKLIDITALNYLISLIKLNMSCCRLISLSALKRLINLKNLDISNNSYINITDLQHLANLTKLQLQYCDLVSICVLRRLVKLEQLCISCNQIVYLDVNFDDMKQLEKLSAGFNRIRDFSSIEKRLNYNNTDEYGQRCFNISGQSVPSKQVLHFANKLRHIEGPNIQLKEIQNKRKTRKIFNNFKQQIKNVVNSVQSNHIQFTSSVVHLFQQLNHAVSQ
ncbi:Conserved_hypothetical protein [Hexamita inflata]|uniref:Uncharacterized protein n=1 Tax=Hexamita inflata TaxID=28002 RepID=A0AA86QND1_9EUKA|nr:Conserved hypothetical protein [Hexamita inflata]